MLIKKLITAYSNNHMKPVTQLCRQNGELLRTGILATTQVSCVPCYSRNGFSRNYVKMPYPLTVLLQTRKYILENVKYTDGKRENVGRSQTCTVGNEKRKFLPLTNETGKEHQTSKSVHKNSTSTGRLLSFSSTQYTPYQVVCTYPMGLRIPFPS
jgi:hypothetical protein